MASFFSFQSVRCHVHCIDLVFQQDLSFGGISMKIRTPDSFLSMN